MSEKLNNVNGAKIVVVPDAKKKGGKNDKPKIVVVPKTDVAKLDKPLTDAKKIIAVTLTPNDLAKHFDTDAKKIRVFLRKHKILKNDDGKYGFSKIDFDKMVKMIQIETDDAKFYDPTKTDSQKNAIAKK